MVSGAFNKVYAKDLAAHDWYRFVLLFFGDQGSRSLLAPPQRILIPIARPRPSSSAEPGPNRPPLCTLAHVYPALQHVVRRTTVH